MKKAKILTITGGIFIVAGVGCAVAGFLIPEKVLPDFEFPKIPSAEAKDTVYSDLTGLPIAADDKTAPTYCIQTPNGTDGARPQAGLNEAGVIFEAIAEAGITRFAAIYQKPTAAVIGPIRSLRLYYLQWDTPFDCTIVHAGGADDALAAVRSGGYKDLTENYTYMYRSSVGGRRWNNLFTNATLLARMNADRGYGNSTVKGFTRMTPAESLKDLVDNGMNGGLVITEKATSDTSVVTAKVSDISVRFGYSPTFNVGYKYDAATNSYLRSYDNGYTYDIYACPSDYLGEVSPENACELKQMSPAVVVAMIVSEKKSWDNYHEDITTLGSGEAYVFQNGYAIKGTWIKNSVADQIQFFNSEGKEIALAPGQTFVEAVPNYGSVDY